MCSFMAKMMKKNYTLAFANFLLYSSFLMIRGEVDHTFISDIATLLSPKNTNTSGDFGNLAASSFTIALASSGYYTGPYVEAKGDITLWDRHVEDSDYSANVVGCWKRDDAGDVAVMLFVGYGVYPSKFGDDKNRLFIASLVYNRECINDAACLGFVPIPSKYKIGGIIEDVSVYDDPNNQKVLKVSIRKEDKWYISYNDERMGYIEDEALSHITDCDEIGWGGMMYTTGKSSSPTQMGNGRFPSEGYSRTGAIAGAHGVKVDGNLTSGRPYIIMTYKPQCYDVKVNDDESPNASYSLLYGGPGC